MSHAGVRIFLQGDRLSAAGDVPRHLGVPATVLARDDRLDVTIDLAKGGLQAPQPRCRIIRGSGKLVREQHRQRCGRVPCATARAVRVGDCPIPRLRMIDDCGG